MVDSSMKETMDVAHFAEKELETILGEITLQNEKLVDIQRKAGVTHSHLMRNSKVIDDIFRITKPRLAVSIMILFVASITLVYARMAF